MELAAILASLCELDPPEATIQTEASGNHGAIARLIALGALVHTGKRQSIVCWVCDTPHMLAVEHAGDGRYHCFCPDTGYHEVPAETLDVYSVDMQWIGHSIRSCLGRQAGSASPPAPLSTLVDIGRFRFGSYNCRLFFARRLADRAQFECTMEIVSRLAGTGPAIVVCTTLQHLIPGVWPNRIASVDRAP